MPSADAMRSVCLVPCGQSVDRSQPAPRIASGDARQRHWLPVDQGSQSERTSRMVRRHSPTTQDLLTRTVSSITAPVRRRLVPSVAPLDGRAVPRRRVLLAVRPRRSARPAAYARDTSGTDVRRCRRPRRGHLLTPASWNATAGGRNLHRTESERFRGLKANRSCHCHQVANRQSARVRPNFAASTAMARCSAGSRRP